jgi:uncharacterized protein
MIKKFSKEIIESMKYYIYLYTDPRNDEIFYVGKGNGNRAFAHLKDTSEKEKVKRIKKIIEEGLEPKIEILIHGIEDENTAKKIEASIIDVLDISKLTNLQRGYESREFGRMSLERINAMYQSDKVTINDPAILIVINWSFRYGMRPIELYDAVRSAWIVGKKREQVKYAFAVYDSVVQEVYKIAAWLPYNSTLNTVGRNDDEDMNKRWEFVGQIADEKIRKKYLFKNVSAYLGPRNPINYSFDKKCL